MINRVHRKTFLCSVAVLLFALLSFRATAQAPQWSFLQGDTSDLKENTKPGPREQAVTFELDGKFYLFGGTVSYTTPSKPMNDLWEFSPETGQWRRLKGSNTPLAVSVYGTLGVAARNNTPSGRLKAVGWGSNGKLYLFGGQSEYGLHDDFWEFDLTTRNWRWLSGSHIVDRRGIYDIYFNPKESRPGARRGSTSWTLGSKLYLMGGFGYGVQVTAADYMNDFWEYNTDTGIWRWLRGSDGRSSLRGVYGSAPALETPGGRIDGTAWVSNGMIYLYGGNGYASEAGKIGYLQDLWVYNPRGSVWRWIDLPYSLDVSYYVDKPTLYSKSVPVIPASRSKALGWENNGKLYLFGGEGIIPSKGLYNDLWELDTATERWRRIIGQDTINQHSSFEDAAIAGRPSLPGARAESFAWSAGSNLYLEGGTGYGEAGKKGTLTDTWQFETTTGNWSWRGGERIPVTIDPPTIFNIPNVAALDNIPGPRYGSNTWENNGKLLLFGGSDVHDPYNYRPYNDLWEFDTKTSKWRWLKGSKTPHDIGKYGTQGVAHPTNLPRSRQKSASWKLGDKLYVFGGTNQFGLLNDLWEYNLTTGNWRWLKGFTGAASYGSKGSAAATNTPGPRSNAVSWMSGGRLYLYGGHGTTTSSATKGYLNDLWVYDPATNNWTWLEGSNALNSSGNATSSNYPIVPPGLKDGTAWELSGKLFLYGGERQNSLVINALWEFDTTTGKWTLVHGSSTSSQASYGTRGVAKSWNSPGGRRQASGWVHRNKLYLLGGSAYYSGSPLYLNDIWEFDLTVKTWTWIGGNNTPNNFSVAGMPGQLAPEYMPGARGGANLWQLGNTLYYYGGHGFVQDTGPDYQNDLWIAEFEDLAFIIKQPQDASVKASEATYFEVNTAGGKPTYQWQTNNGKDTFSNISDGDDYSGANTSRLLVNSVSPAMHGYKYRVLVQDGTVMTSYEAALNINSAPLHAGRAVEKETTIAIFPNPVQRSGRIDLHLTGLRGRQVGVALYNSHGQQLLLQNFKVKDGEVHGHISLSDMVAGLYYLHFSDGNIKKYRKLVVQ